MQTARQKIVARHKDETSRLAQNRNVDENGSTSSTHQLEPYSRQSQMSEYKQDTGNTEESKTSLAKPAGSNQKAAEIKPPSYQSWLGKKKQ